MFGIIFTANASYIFNANKGGHLYVQSVGRYTPGAMITFNTPTLRNYINIMITLIHNIVFEGKVLP